MSKRNLKPLGGTEPNSGKMTAKVVQPKSKVKKKNQPKEAIVLIPITYNDDSNIPRSVLNTIFDQIFLAFEGWTIESTVKGAYKMKSGEKRVEQSLKISIVLREFEIPTLEKLASEWASELGQEAIMIKITDFEVKFVPPRSAEE